MLFYAQLILQFIGILDCQTNERATFKPRLVPLELKLYIEIYLFSLKSATEGHLKMACAKKN